MTDADMIEAMARAIGPGFIGNRMPDMSGDPLRKATPYERRRIDEAVVAALAVVRPEIDRLRAENVELAHCEKVRSAAINKSLTDAQERADEANTRADFAHRLFDQREEILAALGARNAELRAENARLRSALLDAREFVEVEHERREDSCLDADHEYLSEVYDLAAKIDAVLFPRAALSPSPADGEGR